MRLVNAAADGCLPAAALDELFAALVEEVEWVPAGPEERQQRGPLQGTRSRQGPPGTAAASSRDRLASCRKRRRSVA